MQVATLRVYADLKQSYADGMPRYLDDRYNLAGTRLLTKCRLGYVMLMQSVGRMLHWPEARATCAMCGAAVEMWNTS